MSRFQRGDNALHTREVLDRVQRLLIGRLSEGNPPLVFEIGELRSDARIIEACANRMGLGYLTLGVLKYVAFRAVQDSGPPARQGSPVSAAVQAVSCRLDRDELNVGVVKKRGENTDRVGPATHAGNDRGGKPSSQLEALSAGLAADHRLKIPDQRGVGMRTCDATDHVMSIADVGNPIADRLVHRILESFRPGLD